MSIAQAVLGDIHNLPKGKPFTRERFLSRGPRGTVDRTLSRLVRRGEIQRVARGVFVRPRTNRFVGGVLPDVRDVIEAIAGASGETVQIHGAEAARRFGLSSQVPTAPVFHTSASSRAIRIGNIVVRMVHTSNRRRLQFAGEAAGAALAALWYLGKDNVTPEAVAKVEAALGPEDFERLRSADMPAWMAKALADPDREAPNG
ncbi:MAG: type IV toxin-antitoxin system AbiEi family antitoxin domain-containing protein [Gammaproteobacteria bacterium]|nr:type IV toxin-antitoxin system AbiEi family antitoxin domain-containing protein [Gammaproteobacteria bacterium]